ncbi:unknown [Prevotella sp. CAG:1058]|nr:unknown [Prevotella sp. CAG:1058]
MSASCIIIQAGRRIFKTRLILMNEHLHFYFHHTFRINLLEQKTHLTINLKPTVKLKFRGFSLYIVLTLLPLSK